MGTISMEQIRSASIAAGSNWFSPGAMRFFRTRLPQTGQADSRGRFWFVTSEAPHDGSRKYSVRVFIPETGTVETHGGFRSHSSSRSARNAMAAAIAACADPLSA